jgi:hypothetical protein
MSDELEPIIRKIERRAQARPGRTVVAVNQKTGQALSEAGLLDFTINRILNEVALYEVTSDEWLWIDNASAAIAVFPTNERSDLTFRIRLKATKENATRIAEALHDQELGPAQVLFRTVSNYLGTLLEESARQGRESAIERIAVNRPTWQAEVARAITSKLHLDAEIIFQMQRPQPTKAMRKGGRLLFGICVDRCARDAQVGGDDVGGAPYFHTAGLLEFTQQAAAFVGLQGSWRGRKPGCVLIDAGANDFGARGIERFVYPVLCVNAGELPDHALQVGEQRQVDIEAQCRDVFSVGIFHADRGTLRLPPVSKCVRIVRDDLRIIRIGNPRQA